jgi:diaminopimelate decarboxylase
VGESILIADHILELIAKEVGTPAYVYDAGAIRANFKKLSDAVGTLPHRIRYSVKCNSNYSILSLLRELGAGADIVSGGELFRCLRAGFDPADMIFSGVGKTKEELRYALEQGVGLINVESEGEMKALIELAGEFPGEVDFGLRINPDVTAEAHPYTSTGHGAAKFGVSLAEVDPLVALAASSGKLRLKSVGAHIGSQITVLGPYVQVVEKIVAIASRLREGGADTLDDIDIGGGFGIGYAGKPGMDLKELFCAIGGPLEASGFNVLMEPGRSILGTAGILLSEVVYCKRSGGTNFAIIDAAMNDLVRPSLYQAEHGLRVIRPAATEEKVWDFVGPVCETGDFLAVGRTVSGIAPGAIVGIEEAGAYGFSMSSRYNSRRQPVEVLVDEGRYALIRRRDQYDDIVSNEIVEAKWEGTASTG